MARPRVSVVIPTHERPRQLAACLGALAASELEREAFEVLVVDDGSASPLDPVIEPLGDELDLRLLRQPNRGPAAARNAGAEAARAELIAFTDDDCLPSPAWLPALLEGAARHPGAALGGPIRNALDANPYSRASQTIVDLAYSHYNSPADPLDVGYLISMNIAVPAGTYRRIGGFDASFRYAEDRELADRWLAAGERMAWVPDASIEHAHALTLGGFLRQHFRYGRGAYAYQRERQRRGLGLSGLDPSFYRRIAAAASRAVVRRRPREALALCLSQLANTAGFLAEAVGAARGRPVARRGPRDGPPRPDPRPADRDVSPPPADRDVSPQRADRP